MANRIVIGEIEVDLTELEHRIFKKIQIEFFDYVHLVAEWFAYSLLTGSKYVVLHETDDSQNCRDQLVHTQQTFQLNHYPQLYHFTQEYNGAKTPITGKKCSIQYETYQTDLKNLTDSWLSGQQEDVLVELFSDLSSSQLNQFIPTCLEHVTLRESKVTLSLDLIQKIHIIDSKLLFELGKEQALLQIRKEELADAIQKKQEEEMDLIITLLIKKLQSQYKQTYQESFPLRIDRPLFEEKIKPLLFQLLEQGIPIHHIRALSKYAYWSPSVCDDLEKFR